jgi:hypothetical protein
VPFYLHFSNRDPVAAVAGRLGAADISVGHAAFDEAAAAGHVELARELAALVQRFCESLPPTPQACRSAAFEGR